MNAFLTGSRAYGTPTGASDTDLVVLVSDADLETLIDSCANPDGDPDYDDSQGASLRFGSLNLICFSDAEIFGAWKEATAELIARKPVTREGAVEAISAKVQAVMNARWEAEGEALAAMEAAALANVPMFMGDEPSVGSES